MTAKENMSIMAAVLPYPGQISLFDRLVRRSAILRKVLITDDRLASRKGLRALMLTQPDIQVIGEAANGKKAIQLIKERICGNTWSSSCASPTFSRWVPRGLEGSSHINL
ncbi:MAG: hypothetical protein P8Y37_12485 [Anaerolineales bacterium]